MNYRMIVQYDGTRYEGWQRQQRTAETVQGKLEAAAAAVTGESVQVIGAGRTDAGVHAAGQTANFHLAGKYRAKALEEALNRALPDDIAVSCLEEAPEEFHSRFGALRKVYRYRIRTGAAKKVFERRYVWQYGKSLDLAAMERAASFLTGTHDFTSFCGNKKMKKSAVRTVHAIRFSEEAGELRIDYEGNGFLQGMVRILTGTLVEIGEGKRRHEDAARALAAKDRAEAGFTAPPQGLTLLSVVYEDGYGQRK